ncbi:MAG: branched-chain-amino-acid transaminase, partial [Streptococcaceae bacterium]|nr:branched-chain-amino-acid transaminase [Streptococcaceae bacterium]
MNSKNIDWKNLGFDYMELPYRYRAYFREGSWQEQGLTEQSHLTLSEASTGLHYGQQGYEGLKAYRTKEGSIQLFRPEENAKRLQETCRRLAMPEVPTEMFVDAVKQVVLANEDFVPPYETGATLYLRPLIIGVGGMLGVQSAKEFLFTIFAMPVGVYFNKNKGNKKFVIAHEDDRVAPKGTGHIKAGGNYGGSIQTIEQAHEKGYDGVLYLDSKTHEYVEEAGSANV